MDNTGITIIGAGVVGLSIASYLSESGFDILLLEQHPSFGNETSSRNSEVIHASIYYPANSLKGKLCLEGNELMYEICSKNNIPHVNCGKLIVATNKEQEQRLPQILEIAKNNGAKGVKIVTQKEIEKLEPKVYSTAAIYCPTSGVVDSHQLMQYFEANAINNNAVMLYRHEVIGIQKNTKGFIITVKDDEENIYEFETEILINSAGHNSDIIAELAGIDIDRLGYRLNFSKGIYYRVHKQLEKYPKMLIYPVPPEEGAVGIHTCPDLYGGMRLGPYDYWVDNIDYSVKDEFRDLFYNSAKQYLPFLNKEDFEIDMSGIHPKLQRPGEPIHDFVIREESDKGLPGLINLIGIESPGLTSSPAIGKYVLNIVKNL